MSYSPAPLARCLSWIPIAAGAIALAGLLVLGLLRGSAVLWIHAQAPNDNVFPESAIVQAMVWAARGEPIYRDLNEMPVVTTLYGPLTYYLPGWFGALIGIDAAPGIRTIARWWSFLCFVGIGGILWWLAQRFDREDGGSGYLAGPLAALLWIVLFPILPLAVTARCDLQFLLVNLLTIVWVDRWRDDDSIPWSAIAVAMAGILVSASIRQIVLGPPAAIATMLLMRRVWTKAGVFVIGTPVAASALMLLADRLTGGHFITNVIKAGDVEYRLTTMREHFGHMLASLVLLGMPAILWCVGRWSQGRLSALSLWPFCALPFIFLLAGKRGSSPAYYAEIVLALIPLATAGLLLIARSLMNTWTPDARAEVLRLAAVWGVSTMLCCTWLGALAGNDVVGLIREPRVTQEMIDHEIEVLKRLDPKPVGLPLRWSLLVLESDYISSDLFQHDLIVTAGQMTWTPVTDKLRAGHWPLLAVDGSVVQWSVLEPVEIALREGYEVDAEASAQFGPGLSLWRPKRK